MQSRMGRVPILVKPLLQLAKVTIWHWWSTRARKGATIDFFFWGGGVPA